MILIFFKYSAKQLILSTIILVFFSLKCISQGNTWEQMRSLDVLGRRYLGVGFSIGTKGYVGTGVVEGNNRKDFWEYDPLTNTWSQKADFAGGLRAIAVGFSIGTKGYVGTGYDSESLVEKNDFWEYDPAVNKWTQKANFGGAAREVAVGFSIGSKGYIGTGRTNNFLVYFNDFWEYDPLKDSWTQRADFRGTERYAASVFVIGTKAYVGTGTDNTGTGFNFRKDFWEYDQQKNSWIQKADFGGSARELAASFCIGTKGYLGTGYNQVGLNDFWEYDPAVNKWTQKANFTSSPRYAAVGFSIQGYGFIGMGASLDGQKSDLWKYTPGTLIK